MDGGIRRSFPGRGMLALLGVGAALSCGTAVPQAAAQAGGPAGAAAIAPVVPEEKSSPEGASAPSPAAPGALPAEAGPAAEPLARGAESEVRPVSPVVVSLEEAVQRALSANLAIRAKQFEYQSIQANEITAALIPNPNISAGASNFTSGPANWSAVLSQTIELAGKRGRRIDSAEAASQVEASSVDDLKRLTVLLVKQAYVNIIVAKAQAEQTRVNLKELDDELRLQSLRARTGDLSELDYLRIEQQRFQFESDAADAEMNLQVAKVNFRAAVGVDQLPEQFDVTGTFDLRELKLDRQTLYGLAEQNRPDVRQAVADVRRAQADNRLAHALAVPDVVPSLGYGWVSDRPDQIFNNTAASNGNILGVSIDIPLFSRNQGEIERTAKDAQRTGVVKDAAIVQAHVDVDVATAGMINARVKYVVLRDNYFPKAKSIRERTELAYRQGAASLLDFLDAERQFRSAAFAFIAAKGSYDSALYQLEAAVGGPVK